MRENAHINLKGNKWALLGIIARKSAAQTVNLAQNLMVSTLAVGAEFGRATALCERGAFARLLKFAKRI